MTLWFWRDSLSKCWRECRERLCGRWWWIYGQGVTSLQITLFTIFLFFIFFWYNDRMNLGSNQMTFQLLSRVLQGWTKSPTLVSILFTLSALSFMSCWSLLDGRSCWAKSTLVWTNFLFLCQWYKQKRFHFLEITVQSVILVLIQEKFGINHHYRGRCKFVLKPKFLAIYVFVVLNVIFFVTQNW